MKSGVCLYPGSFDPVTVGHLDIIRRGAAIFDRVIVGVLVNAEKKCAFTMEERFGFLCQVTAGLPNVEVITFSGLTAELCRQKGVRVLLRGLRGPGDVEGEMRNAKVNGMLLPGLETIYLGSSSGTEQISSSLVREIASLGGDITPFVPPEICRAVQERYKR